jgi:hypothetical protein
LLLVLICVKFKAKKLLNANAQGHFQSSKDRDHFEYHGVFKFKGVKLFYSAKFKVKTTASKYGNR